jgi:hypothetical protein
MATLVHSRPKLAARYNDSAEVPEPVTPLARSVGFAAEALSTNVYDLVTWDNALVNGKVVSPASFKQTTTAAGFVAPDDHVY